MTDPAGHAAVSSLLAAWALDACDGHESAAVERHLRGCETCRTETRALVDAAQHLGDHTAVPPGPLRDRVLAIDGGRLPVHRVPDRARPYAATVVALDALLWEVGAQEWTQVTASGQWNVRDLVVHLTATDNLVAHRLGLPVDPPVAPGADPATRTDLLLSRPVPPSQVWLTWRRQADAICRAAPYCAPPDDLLVSRAFETWIHAVDIGRAIGRPLPPPPADHLHAIADFGARLLPLAAARHRIANPGDTLRLVLTGTGGGRWTLPLGGYDTAPTVEVTLDVVEFCMLMGDRVEPRAVDVMIRGDVELGYDLLEAGPSLAAG